MYSTIRRLCVLTVATILALGCMPDGSEGDDGDDPIALAGGSMGAGGDTGGDIIPVGGAEMDDPQPQMGGANVEPPPDVRPPVGGEPSPPSPPPAGNCDRNGFEPSTTRAAVERFGIQYSAEGGAPAGTERFWVQIYSDFNGPTQPGRYTVDNENFADCGLCLLVFTGCNGQSCEKTFYANNATVNITALDGPGGRFAATVESAVFQEVEIEQDSFRSVPVPGGESWCIGDYDFDEAIEQGANPGPGPGGDPQNPDVCNQPGVNCVGDIVPDFELLNCESGEMESIQAASAGERATWLILTAGWCPACAEWLGQISMIAADPMTRGIKFVYVFGENTQRGEPTVRQCQQYARRYGGAANFYIDHDGENSFATTFQHMWPYVGPNGEFGLPWNGVLNAQTMEYVHADNSGTDLQTEVVNLLQ
jgi:hypothetical protein